MSANYIVRIDRNAAPRWWAALRERAAVDPHARALERFEDGNVLPEPAAEALRMLAASLTGWPTAPPFPYAFQRVAPRKGPAPRAEPLWTVRMRPTAEQREAIVAAAKAEGVDVNEFLLRAGLERARAR